MSEMMLLPSKSDVVATANANKESDYIPYHIQGVIVDDAVVDNKKEEAVSLLPQPPSLHQCHPMLQGRGQDEGAVVR